MMGDDDLRAHLPEPPPPAPKLREAAIDAALARFDGSATSAPSFQHRSSLRWTWLQRPPAGRLIAAALVGAISLPFAWTMFIPGAPAIDERASSMQRYDQRSPTLAVTDAPEASTVTAEPSALATSDVALPETSATPPPPSLRAEPEPQSLELAQIVPAPAPSADTIEVVGERQARAFSMAASPIVSMLGSDANAKAEASNVVADARNEPERLPARGDWNSCTVDDPIQKLSKCSKLAKAAAKAVRAQADAYLSRGLQMAWQGNIGGAIAAFDQAISVAPELSVAYLNRGLANDQQGFRTLAIADLDRAVALAPQSAQAYFNRARLLRKYGDARRAEADEKRAADLDPRYKAVLK